ncbi:hypothetical protein [Pseudoxanthomonas koreensis]|uniref:hypothetical protein n=1 Tax=Pseudoxanthomonas koreensis TaxID=266061 RepID=UPI00139156A3|nr:hypothetical protein [Pseudoxanthomonas koreensis]
MDATAPTPFDAWLHAPMPMPPAPSRGRRIRLEPGASPRLRGGGRHAAPWAPLPPSPPAAETVPPA